MALKPCPNCGNHISDKATQCPKCGIEITENSFSVTPPSQETEELERSEFLEGTPHYRKRWLILLLIIVIAIPIGVVMYLNYGKTMKPGYKAENYRGQDTNVDEQIESEELETEWPKVERIEDNYPDIAALDTKAGDSKVSETGDNKKSQNEEELQLDPDIFLGESYYYAGGDKYLSLNFDISSKLKKLGFKEISRETELREYEGDQFWPFETIKYKRDVNGKKVDIEIGNGTCGYIEFKFSNPEEFESFKSKLIKNRFEKSKRNQDTYIEANNVEGLTLETKGKNLRIHEHCV